MSAPTESWCIRLNLCVSRVWIDICVILAMMRIFSTFSIRLMRPDCIYQRINTNVKNNLNQGFVFVCLNWPLSLIFYSSILYLITIFNHQTSWDRNKRVRHALLYKAIDVRSAECRGGCRLHLTRLESCKLWTR